MSARPNITQREAVAHAFELLRAADDLAARAANPLDVATTQAWATRALGWLKLADSGMLAPGEWTTSDYPPGAPPTDPGR